MYGSINKSPTKLSMQRKINWHGDLYMNEKNLHGKTPPSDFKAATPENPLLSKQSVSKGISVSYTNLQLNPYLNTQLDLFYNDNLSFSMHGSQYVTNQLRGSQYVTWSPTWEGCWLQSSSVHHTMKNMKLLGHKTLRCIKHSSFFKRKKN